MKKLIIIFIIIIIIGCKSTPKHVGGLYVDMNSPNFKLGEIETQLHLLYTGFKKVFAEVSYYPYEDAVCLNFRSDFFIYNQFWSRDGRDAFVKAFDDYNTDYIYRNLESKSKKSKNKYGTEEGYLTWQMFTFTALGRANMDLELGYFFRDRAPYFTVTQKTVENVDPKTLENNPRSQEIMMHFTRAQAQVLVEMFNQEFLLKSVSQDELQSIEHRRDTAVDVEVY